MNRKYRLAELLKTLFSHERVKHAETARLIEELDYEALSQALRYEMEPIYRFRTDNYCEESCEYRSELLLPVQGTRVYEQPILAQHSVVTLTRSMELWILDDLSIAILSNVKIADVSDLFNGEYRTIRTRELDALPYEINLDLETLAATLLELSKTFRDCSLPFSEL